MGRRHARLCELGPIELEVGTMRRALRGRRSSILLARLSIASPIGCPTRDLVDAIWSIERPPTAAQSLANTVADIRRFAGSKAIETTSDGYRLGEDVESDRRDLVSHLLAAERLAPDDPERALKEIRWGKALWRGEPYSGLPDDDFEIEADRYRLRDAYEQMGRLEVAFLAQTGRHDESVELAATILAANPLDEDVWIAFIASLLATGQRSRAFQAARRALRTFQTERIRPGSSLRKLERDLAGSPTVGIVEPATGPDRSGWQILGECVDLWASGRLPEAISELESHRDALEHDDVRRFARALANSDPRDGWARGRWSEVVGVADRLSGRAERVIVSLDASALERQSDGLSMADAEIEAAADDKALVRCLRVRFMVGCAHPLDDNQRDTVEKLKDIRDDEARIEAVRFDGVVAAKEGHWARCLELLESYEDRVAALRPEWFDDFAALSRSVLQLSGITSQPAPDSPRRLFPSLWNVRTVEVARLWQQNSEGDYRFEEVEPRLAAVNATIPPDTAAGLSLLALEYSKTRGDVAVGERVDVAEQELEGVPWHRYWQLLPYAIAKVAIRSRDRRLARSMLRQLKPWRGEHLGLWPLDLILGPADRLLEQLAEV